MNSVKEQTIKSVKWNGIERFVGQGIQFLLTLFMARLLTPSDYGLIGLLTIFITISQTFIDSGFNTALLRTKSPKEEDYCTVFYFNIFIAFIVYIVLYVSAPYIATFFRQVILCQILRVYAISLIVNSLMAVQVSRLQIALDFRSLAMIRVISVLVSGIFGISFAFWGYGVWALVFQNLISSILYLLLIVLVCRWYPQ